MSVLNAPNPYETVVMDRRNASAGFDSIGAVATQKHQSDALNLGFPSAYASVYARNARVRPQFLQSTMPREVSFYQGDDLQHDIHQQRKRDADFMAGAKVRSTQLSRVRYVGTPHGMGHLPNAKLVQRVFANPTTGANIPYSTRQDYTTSPFHMMEGAHGGNLSGGVLRSPEGVAFGRRVLQDRIRQLDNIQTAQQAFQGVAPPAVGMMGGPRDSAAEANTATMPTLSESSAIELNLLLDGLTNNLMAGESGAEDLNRFTYGDATRALLLIFRMAPVAPPDFFDDLVGKVDTILRLLAGALNSDQTGDTSAKQVEGNATALSLQILFKKLREYLQRMIEGAPANRVETIFNPLTKRNERRNVLSQEQGQNLSPRERLALSKALVANLGFSKLLRTRNVREVLSKESADGEMDAQEEQRYRDGDMDSQDDGDDDNDEDGDEFDRPAPTREDGIHLNETGVARGNRNFSLDERNSFGRQSRGVGILPTYFGEESKEQTGIEEQEGLAAIESGGIPSYEVPESLAHLRPKLAQFDKQLQSLLPSPPKSGEEVRGFFDKDTQGFNIGSTRATKLKADPFASNTAAAIEIEDAPSSVSSKSSRRKRLAERRKLVISPGEVASSSIRLPPPPPPRYSLGVPTVVPRTFASTEDRRYVDAMGVPANLIQLKPGGRVFEYDTTRNAYKPRPEGSFSVAESEAIRVVGDKQGIPIMGLKLVKKPTIPEPAVAAPKAKSKTLSTVKDSSSSSSSSVKLTPAQTAARAATATKVQQAKAILAPYDGALPRSNSKQGPFFLSQIGSRLVAKGLITAPTMDPFDEPTAYRLSLQRKLKAFGAL
jgi:hypothetical protein